MTHVQFKHHKNGTSSLVVDGIDLSKVVLEEGFRIELGEFPAPPRVHVVFAADILDVDLPEAVLRAQRAADDANEGGSGTPAALAEVRQELLRLHKELVALRRGALKGAATAVHGKRDQRR